MAQPSVPAHIDLALQAAQHEVAVLYQRLEVRVWEELMSGCSVPHV